MLVLIREMMMKEIVKDVGVGNEESKRENNEGDGESTIVELVRDGKDGEGDSGKGADNEDSKGIRDSGVDKGESNGGDSESYGAVFLLTFPIFCFPHVLSFLLYLFSFPFPPFLFCLSPFIPSSCY